MNPEGLKQEPFMKIAVLSDIHGNAAAFRAVLGDMQALGIGDSIFLGDLVMKGPQPAEVLSLLRGTNPSRWILGNTDLWFRDAWCRPSETIQAYRFFAESYLSPAETAFLLRHPKSATVFVEGLGIRCLHGSARRMTEGITAYAPPGLLQRMLCGVREPLVLCGHSHIPCILRDGPVAAFNVGSVGCPYDGNPAASYGILDFEKNMPDGLPALTVRRVPYDVEAVLRVAQERRFPELAAYGIMLRSGLRLKARSRG